MVCDNARDASVNAKEWIWGLCVERWRSLRIRVMCDSEHNSSTMQKTAKCAIELFFSSYVRDRTERSATDPDSHRYDARGQNLGAVRRLWRQERQPHNDVFRHPMTRRNL